MSILSGLIRHPGVTYPTVLVDLDDVREALTNPTDEQVEAIAEQVECSCEAGWADTCPIHGAARWMVRAVLAAAAAGGDAMVGQPGPRYQAAAGGDET